MMLRRILATGWLCALVVTGCDCDSATRLVIADPVDGATLTVDVDPSTSGFQYDVVVRVGVLDVGETVRLYPDVTVLDDDPDAFTPFTAVVGSDGTVRIRTRLDIGENQIVACARDACTLRSATARVMVEGVACPDVSFTSPAPGTEDSIRLGPADDADGTPCGAEFATNVVANVDAPDGTDVSLLVNDVPAASAQVVSGAVDFGAVVLGNRGDDPNALAIAIDDGSDCMGMIGKPVFVDCDGASCAITAPATTTPFLNQSHDTSPDPGLQLNVTVESDADTAGRTTRLILDDDEPGALSVTSMATGDTATAIFAGVDLAEGTHTAQAECEDPQGNVTRSTVATWNVDTVACDVAIAAPTAGQDIGLDDDLDAGATGIQIETNGTATGSDCTEVRAAPCSAISGEDFGTLTANAYTLPITLGSAPTQSICVEVRDAAGNVGDAQVDVDVDTDAPSLTIVTPVANARFNRLGGAAGMFTYVADVVPATPACDVAFAVDCEAVGEDVELVDGTDVLGTAACLADGTSAFGGRATFTSVALPTADTTFSVFARQTAAGSTGTSNPVALFGDCSAPTLTITSPMCGSVVSTADDTNPGLSGIQRSVTVASPNDPQIDVELTIISTTMSLSYNATSTMPTGTDHVFPNATFAFAATFDVVGTGADPFGNAAQTPSCQVVVTSLPTLAFTAPAANTVINAANAAASDCSGAAGLQVQVTATTNATNGSAATVQIGTGAAVATTVMGGTISACADAPQGVSNIEIEVVDVDTSDGVSGTATALRQITIDTLPPAGTFNPAVVILDHRVARVQLSFTALDDAGQPFSAYRFRCAGSAITTEPQWNAATEITVPTAPLPAGMAEQFVFGSMAERIFRTGVRYQCAWRAADIGGNLTPLPAMSTVIHPQFEVTRVEGVVANGQMGFNGTRVIGDVNDDGRPDVLATGLGSAYLWLSGATGATSAVSIAFTRGGTSRLGVYAAGLGDFDGDGIDDFAISDILEDGDNRGGVYVFRGRTDWSAFGSSFSVTTTGCVADLCIRGSVASQFVGYDITGVGDFDGDSDHDLAIGIRGSNQILVLSGRSLAVPETITLASPLVPGTPGLADGFLISGPAGSTDFGWRMAALGDTNGDSRPDLAVMSVGWNGSAFALAPAIHRVNGRTRGVAGLTAIPGTEVTTVVADRVLPATMGTFGLRSTLGAFDFDGDGDRDIAVREPQTGGRGVRIFFNDGAGGFTQATSVEVVATLSAANDFVGVGVGSSFHPTLDVGDIDGDGFEDMVAGAIEAGAASGVAAGALAYGRTRPGTLPSTIDWVESSQAAVINPLPLPSMVMTPSTAFRWIGYAGDVDGDGFEDITVADPSADGSMPTGRLFILH